ncbi:MAG TPA: hypothetical protein VFV67_18945 [Actinophytocola sp.]|uniref:hypothetical protein n=1 Tax=Actinophytocola sp. TaxID=1872138 RepID=UPI002DBF01AA|nr:hypothetical protein [Actinophytocola sp.]HEU5472730.1 hypothetical protein [Actinophytocola sp.]
MSVATTEDHNGRALEPVERMLVEHVERGELLDLAGDAPVDEAVMRTWGQSRTVSAAVIRDIVRGRLAPDPDPHGLRLRGARISGRIDLENITSTVGVALYNCLLEEGMIARDATLAGLVLTGCLLEHPTEPALDADRLTTTVLNLASVIATAHNARGAITVSGAHLGGLTCRAARLRNDSGPAVDAGHLRVVQSMRLSRLEAIGAGELGAVRLLGAHLGQLNCGTARLRNGSGPALLADSLRVDLSLLLRRGFEAIGAGELGAVRLLDAHLGQLECDGANLRNGSGPALFADRLHVDRSVFLRDGFEAIGAGELGAVRLPAAHLGHLDFRAARVRNDSGPAVTAGQLRIELSLLFRGGFAAIGGGDNVAVDLTGVQVGGLLELDPAAIEHSSDPIARLAVDGMVYTGLPRGVGPGGWLTLVRAGTRTYAAQPYQQLAAAHRAAGDDGQARRVLRLQRHDQIWRRALTGRAARAWARFTGVTLGYGYQPWRALIGLLTVVIAAVLLAVHLGAHGGLTQVHNPPSPTPMGCTVVDRIGVGLDLGTPLITTGAKARCEATNTPTGQILTVTGWVLRLLAWAFATLFIVGFTSAVRKT